MKFMSSVKYGIHLHLKGLHSKFNRILPYEALTLKTKLLQKR